MADSAEITLQGKAAFITGAGSGIGLQIATWFLSNGANIIAIDTSPTLHNTIVSSWSASSLTPLSDETVRSRLATDVVDVTDWTAQAATFNWAIEQFAKIDYVLPCAGIGERPWLPRVSIGDVGAFVKPNLAVLDVNLTGALYTVSLAIQQFARQGFGGRIILISSICGIYAIPDFPIYTATKHALVGFTRSYAPALKRSGIMINAICPAIVRTGISTEAFYERMEELGMLTPMETLIAVVRDLVLDQEMKTGGLYECGPNGVKIRGMNEAEYADVKTNELCRLLEERARGSFDLGPK